MRKSQKSSLDPTFRLLLAYPDVPGFESLRLILVGAKVGAAKDMDTLLCDVNTQWASID